MKNFEIFPKFPEIFLWEYSWIILGIIHKNFFEYLKNIVMLVKKKGKVTFVPNIKNGCYNGPISFL